MLKDRLGAGLGLLVMAVFAGFGALAEPAVAAPPAQVDCHQRLGPGGTIALGADLVCGPGSDDREPALVILGPVTVDLNGHTLRCVGGLRFGIVVGSNVKLKNGIIRGCSEAIVTDGSRNALERLALTHNDVGVTIEGGVRNTLTAILAADNRVGFRMTDGSDGNTLSASTASNNADVGFLVDDGQRNVLQDNHAVGNGRGFVIGLGESRTQLTGNSAESNDGDGFAVTLAKSVVLKGNRSVANGGDGFQILQSNRTQILDNEADGNLGNGFLVTASGNASEDANRLQRNTALGNGRNGIAIDITSIRNRVVGNTATGQVAPFFDLFDANPDCRRPANSWTRNTFVSKSPECLK